MEDYKIKNIISIEDSCYRRYEGFRNIENKYVLGNGILINSDGEVLWNKTWDHRYTHAEYIEKHDVIITNRCINYGMGGDFYLGVACIDIKTGEYKWKHYYDPFKTRENLRNVRSSKDINLVEGFERLNDDYIICGKFIVKIEDGSYEHVKKEELTKYKEHIIEKKLRKMENYCSESWEEDDFFTNKKKKIVNFSINSAWVGDSYIDGVVVRKKDYFFNKCDAVIEDENNIFIFGTPAKRNKENSIMFKVCKKDNKVYEIELPFRGIIEGVYDFLDKGYLIKESRKKVINLWYMDKKCLE